MSADITCFHFDAHKTYCTVCILIQGEHLLREDDILNVIEEQGDTIALLLLPGVQYYTGQVFDVKRITDAARKKVTCDTTIQL